MDIGITISQARGSLGKERFSSLGTDKLIIVWVEVGKYVTLQPAFAFTLGDRLAQVSLLQCIIT